MMIDCAKARELSDSYIDGELEEADCLAYEEHISCCDACHEEYDMLKKISADLSATAAPLPEGFAARAHNALVEEQFASRKNKDKKKFVFPYYRTASVMAAALVIAVVGKYGIYDTYKKVNDDSARVAAEIEAEAEPQVTHKSSEFGNVPDVKVEEPAIATNESEVKSSLPENELTVIPESADTEQVKPADVPAENTPEYKTERIMTNPNEFSDTDFSATEVIPPADVAPATEEAVPAEDTAVYNPEIPVTNGNVSEVEISKARMIEPDMDSVIVDEAETEVKASSGGGAAAKKQPESHPESESVVLPEVVGGGGTVAPTELVPATVIIHNNGDGSMMMFKKFLLTFLDSSEIADNGSEITVTVTADEYDGVMQYIKSNEYVKSVREGTPFDGKAVINIK